MLPLPPVYPITSAASPLSLAAQVRRFGDAGFPVVQFRAKHLEARSQWEELRTCLQAAAENGGWPLVIVNDRADLAVLAAGEGFRPWGLHLGQEDLPPAEARRLPGLADLHFGTSTHGEGEWSAVDPACDHAGAGPFRATATKVDHAAPIGREGLARACTALRAQGLTPVAIGGLRPEDAETCYAAGAESLAMTGALALDPDPAEALWRAQATRWRIQPPVRRGQGILLVGSSGAGKTTLAAALGERLGLPALDLDQQIERAEGRSIPAIFAQDGEAAFRELEVRLLARCLESPAVLALGGGAWETGAVRRLAAASGFTIQWLAERPGRCWTRAGGDPERPLAASREIFLARHRQRIQRWSELPCVLPLGRAPGVLAVGMAAALD